MTFPEPGEFFCCKQNNGNIDVISWCRNDCVCHNNHNTHSPAWLYERFELYYTPEHQSWLNMAEIELSILSRECINRRISNQKTLTSKVALETKTAII